MGDNNNVNYSYNNNQVQQYHQQYFYQTQQQQQHVNQYQMSQPLPEGASDLSLYPGNGIQVPTNPPPPPPPPSYPQMSVGLYGVPFNATPNNFGVNAMNYNSIPPSFPPPPPPPPPPLPPHNNNIPQYQYSNNYQNNKRKQHITNNNTRKKKNRETDNSCVPTSNLSPLLCKICSAIDPATYSTSFPNEASLQNHISAHTKCRHSGCNFEASPKLVNAHYSSNHGRFAGRGLKTVFVQIPGSRVSQRFKICVGNHPDDIKAWIEERKKKFPTRKRLECLTQQRQRIKREGGISSLPTSTSTPSSDSNKRIKEDADDINKKDNQGVKDNSLTSLMSCYESSQSSDEDGEKSKNSNERNLGHDYDDNGKDKEESTQKSPTSNPISQGTTDEAKDKNKQCIHYLRKGFCRNGDTCRFLHDESAHEQFIANKDKRRLEQSQKDKQKNKNRINNHTSGQSSLLRNLLNNDIRRERSLTLQLLRYIVDCNFLQQKRDHKEK